MSGATARRSPFIFATWPTGVMSGDDHCRYAPWFKAHYAYDKVARNDSRLSQWKAEHAVMVDKRVDTLRASGEFIVFHERQNAFELEGSNRALLKGIPDIIAVRIDRAFALIIDCKTGQRRDKDYWQVIEYMLFVPRTKVMVRECQEVRGQLQYPDGVLDITPTQAAESAQRMKDILKVISAPEAPPRVPSEQECGFCDIPAECCPDRMAAATPAEPEQAHDLF